MGINWLTHETKPNMEKLKKNSITSSLCNGHILLYFMSTQLKQSFVSYTNNHLSDDSAGAINIWIKFFMHKFPETSRG